MTAAIISLAVVGFGFAATAVALAIRQAGLREKLARTEAERDNAENIAATAIEELKLVRDSDARQIDALRTRLEQLRGMIYALPDSAANRDVVLSELDRLLSGKAAEDDTDADALLSEDGSGSDTGAG